MQVHEHTSFKSPPVTYATWQRPITSHKEYRLSAPYRKLYINPSTYQLLLVNSECRAKTDCSCNKTKIRCHHSILCILL
jgi:hypothetical protein